jgi:beta-mannosidase
MPAGIFKPARLVVIRNPQQTKESAVKSLFIEEKSVDIFKDGQVPGLPPVQTADWIVNVTLSLRTAIDMHDPVMHIDFPELNLTSGALKFKPVMAKDESTMIWSAFRIKHDVPDLWYPHNLGAPIRYNITVRLPQWNESFTTTTGFRTIVLNMEPYPQWELDSRGITAGDQYHFEINGKPFYSSGTNVIPFDPFYARTNTSQVRWVLESAKAGGQNMVSLLDPFPAKLTLQQVRIWGGGIYQPSDEETGVYNFYEICDELGILAWSELIFSDALYPINDFFLENVKPEVQQNVRRTNRHPSNAQWAAGNENEGIAMYSGPQYLKEVSKLRLVLVGDLITV